MARSKFRKGDVVSLLATVQADSRDGESEGVLVNVIGDYRDIVRPASELKIVRKFFDIGDEIEWEVHSDRKARGIVRAAHAECLWVEAPDETMDTVYPHNKPTLVRTAAEIEAARDRWDSALGRAAPAVAPATPPRNDPPATPAADPADDIQF